MPPTANSRFLFCRGVTDEEGNKYLTDREPYEYHSHSDNMVHMVVEGDSLFSLADKYFAPLERACGYWWVIAEYQPDPILDPSQKLEINRKLIIPSLRILTDTIFSENRRSN